MSAIIPTYNRASLVGRALDSVLHQTYPNVEIVVVDDGSTDDTAARLRAYGNAIKVIEQTNAGPANARNRGIEAAGGEILTFLDSDDYWHHTKLARQVSLLQRVGDSVPCCLCDALIQSPDGQQIRSFANAGLDLGCDEAIWYNVGEILATTFVLFTQAIAIRRSVLERIGGFNSSLRFIEDYELALRLALEGPWAVIRDPLVYYNRDSPGSLVSVAHANDLVLRECAVQLRTTMLDCVMQNEAHKRFRRPFSRELRWARRRLLAASHMRRNSILSIIAPVIPRLDDLRVGLYRNSPWYPRMRVAVVS